MHFEAFGDSLNLDLLEDTFIRLIPTTFLNNWKKNSHKLTFLNKGLLVSKSMQGVVTCFTGTTSTGSITEIACSSSVTFGGGSTYNYCAVRKFN